MFVGKTANVATCSGDTQIKLFNAQNGGVIRTFAGGKDYVYSVAVSGDGNVVAAGGEDGVFRYYNGINTQLLNHIPLNDTFRDAEVNKMTAPLREGGLMPLQPPADVLVRTTIYRMVHIDCLPTLLARGALHAPSCIPNDALPYISIHATQTQADRGRTMVNCGPGGVILDYIGFYFGPRSPTLYRIHTGRNVAQVDQALIVYLVSTAQAVADANIAFAFTDRHSLARVAAWRDTLADLNIVDFDIAYATYWNNKPEWPDRQERKQAEFLVHRTMPWNLIAEIGVLNDEIAERVVTILDGHPHGHRPAVALRPLWYY